MRRSGNGFEVLDIGPRGVGVLNANNMPVNCKRALGVWNVTFNSGLDQGGGGQVLIVSVNGGCTTNR